jgi:hypothetical protein
MVTSGDEEGAEVEVCSAFILIPYAVPVSSLKL